MRIGPGGQISGGKGLAALGATLSVQQVYNLARGAGFPPSTAQQMVAIAQRESGLNPNAFTSSIAGSTEASYGLWQINMSGSLGVARLAQFGISDPSQLLDPATNAAAAFSVWGGNDAVLNGPQGWNIGSDTATVAGKVVNLGYRTKYLAFLAALPSVDTLEAGYSGTPTTISDGSDNSADDSGASATDLAIPLILGVVAVIFFTR